MKTYIVRIYRRDRESPETVAGVVEIVDEQLVRGFKSREELWRILALDDLPGDIRIERRNG